LGALEILFEVAKEIFAEFPLAEMKRIALCAGPGRLMSLRVAAVAANQWSVENKIERAVYNSLELLSIATQKSTAVEIRAGTIVVWNKDEAKVEISNKIPEAAEVLTLKNYEAAIQKFPEILLKSGGKIVLTTSTFDPPLYAPNDYALAKSGAISKENR
jgi:tRNA A37 threonylcarbamoyladenosine modification protein TsaB